MEVGALLIGKEQVRFPQTLEHLGVNGQRIRLEVWWKLQPGVIPALPQEDVDSVVLSHKHGKVKPAEFFAFVERVLARR